MYEDKTFEAILTEAKKEAGTGVQRGEGYLPLQCACGAVL